MHAGVSFESGVNSYSKFLAYGNNLNKNRFIVVDEGQDLSPSEIELIYKINTSIIDGKFVPPVMNIFGDVNQMISTHGVKDWKNLCFNAKIHTLDENFRNPNQVTEFCNKKLPFKMKEVGVDLGDEVSTYKDWNGLILDYGKNLSGCTFIVKDEYFKKDVQTLLDKEKITDCRINTVKEVKGMEMKEVFVVDAEMTDNEKYVAYTRALIKLIVISSVPSISDRSNSLVVQGEE